jgi:hypothetical protein
MSNVIELFPGQQHPAKEPESSASVDELVVPVVPLSPERAKQIGDKLAAELEAKGWDVSWWRAITAGR